MGKVSHINPPGAARYYVLDVDRRPIQVTEAQWRAQSRTDRQLVAEDEVPNGRVWTRFTGIALDESDDRKPFLTESLIGEDGIQEERYATWKEAEAGHKRIVEKYRKAFGAAAVVNLLGGGD